jgi:hypothetical protein
MFTIRGYFTHPDNKRRLKMALFGESSPKDQDKKYTYKTISINVNECEDLLYRIKKESEYQGELGWRLVQVLGNGSNRRDLIFVKEYTDVSTDSGS